MSPAARASFRLRVLGSGAGLRSHGILWPSPQPKPSSFTSFQQTTFPMVPMPSFPCPPSPALAYFRCCLHILSHTFELCILPTDILPLLALHRLSSILPCFKPSNPWWLYMTAPGIFSPLSHPHRVDMNVSYPTNPLVMF